MVMVHERQQKREGVCLTVDALSLYLTMISVRLHPLVVRFCRVCVSWFPNASPTITTMWGAAGGRGEALFVK